MGLRGPAPKATNMRILEGNPSRRPFNDEEPQPDPGAKCPYWVTTGAREIWEEIAPILEGCGVLTEADSVMFAAWCDAVANYKAVSIEIENSALSLANSDDPVYAEKQVKCLIASQRNFAELMVKFGTKFGLSPGDRSAIKVSKPKEESKWQGKLDL